jgi:hypothetical protein
MYASWIEEQIVYMNNFITCLYTGRTDRNYMKVFRVRKKTTYLREVIHKGNCSVYDSYQLVAKRHRIELRQFLHFP